MQFGPDEEERSLKNSAWAKNLARTFEVDVKLCECGGEYYPVAVIKNHSEAQRYLKHVGLPHLPPGRAPPKAVQGVLEFEVMTQTQAPEDLPTIQYD